MALNSCSSSYARSRLFIVDLRLELCEAEVGRELLLVPVLGAVLPNFTNVALNEEAGNIFGKFNGIEKVQVGTFNRRTTWIFFSITDASNSLILLFLKVVASVHHIKVVGLGIFVGIVFLVPLSPSTEKSIVNVFKWLRGQRAARRRLVGRRFGDRSCVPLGST
ncbi:hypothetical protein HG531_005330 [Fusarium graminearum]|nr:hypothetical protein HG531_005330 [Fusarium graminearum]